MASNPIQLYKHQEDALQKMRSGTILYGDVGSGKTLTALSFYLKAFKDLRLFVITTAKKRDTGDWEKEASMLGITNLVVDSWNNIKKYELVGNEFFIFDEQRVVGYQAWSKTFIKIAKKNKWILLSGTPGDTWSDYIPVFIANGFYRNKSDFVEQHIEYDRFVKFPKIKKYHNEGRLIRLRQLILIPMVVDRHTTRHRKYVECKFNKDQYKDTIEKRWNLFTDAPIMNVSELTQTLRRLVAEHYDRQWHAKWILDIHDKVIVFYNYNYELDILINICKQTNKPYAQWNGHKHEEIPDSNKWIYLVQYTSGSEGWNCIDTNIMMFYSLNYSYRTMEQAEGRIDRLNTKFTDLEYFYLTSKSTIDLSVIKAIKTKKKFNESAWGRRFMK